MSEELAKKKKGPEFKSNEYSVWRYIVFLLVCFVGGQLIGGVLAKLFVDLIPLFFEGGILYSIKTGAYYIIAFFFTFIFAVLMLKPILHTTYKSLVTGNRSYKVGYALVCLVVYLIVNIASMLITSKGLYYNPVDIGVRIATLVFVLLFVPFQTSAEELFFRMSLGRLFMKNKVLKSVPMMLLASLISGIIFLLPHLFNPEVRAYGIVFAIFTYFGAGFSLMLMSCLVGSFEGALAVHAINNIWSMFVCSGEVTAASFNPLFFDSNADPTASSITITVLNIVLIVWSIIYRKKHKLAES